MRRFNVSFFCLQHKQKKKLHACSSRKIFSFGNWDSRPRPTPASNESGQKYPKQLFFESKISFSTLLLAGKLRFRFVCVHACASRFKTNQVRSRNFRDFLRVNSDQFEFEFWHYFLLVGDFLSWIVDFSKPIILKNFCGPKSTVAEFSARWRQDDLKNNENLRKNTCPTMDDRSHPGIRAQIARARLEQEFNPLFHPSRLRGNYFCNPTHSHSGIRPPHE